MGERTLFTEEGDEVKVLDEESIQSLQKTQELFDSLKTDLEIISEKRAYQSALPKLIIAGMSTVIESYYDEDGIYCAGKSTTIIVAKNELASLLKLNYILNSKVVDYYISKVFSSLKMSGGYLNISSNLLKEVPIFDINKISEIKDENQIYHHYNLQYEEALMINADLNLTRDEYDSLKVML